MPVPSTLPIAPSEAEIIQQNLKYMLWAIKAGKLDANLEEIKSALQYRQEFSKQMETNQKMAEFRPGDRVVFNNHVRPSYMQGEFATVVALRQKKITVDLERPMGRFNKNVIVPVTLVDKA